MLNSITKDAHKASTTLDFINLWNKYSTFLEKNNASIVFIQDAYKNTSLPSIDTFKGYENRFKSLFKNNNLTFINKKIIEQMSLGNQQKFNFDYTISFDTQFASFIQKYFTGKNFNQILEVEEILYKLIDNNMQLDYIYYVIENSCKEDIPIEGIEENVREIVKFFSLDKTSSIILKNMKPISAIDLDAKTCSAMSIVKNIRTDKEVLNELQYFQKILYILLIKMVIINKEKNSPKQKITALVEFMHSTFNAILARELAIAYNFFENDKDNKTVFFNKVINIDKNTTEKLKNMAWDLALIRIYEKTIVSRPLPEADFFISYFLTFDEGLSQIMDLYPLKAIITLGDGTIQTIHDVDEYVNIEKYKLDSYFTDEMRAYRSQNTKNSKFDYIKLIVELEEHLHSLI